MVLKKLMALSVCLLTAYFTQAQTNNIQILLSDGQVIQPGETPVFSGNNTLSIFVSPFGNGAISATSKGELIGLNTTVSYSGPNYPVPVMADFALLPDQSGGYFVTSFGGILPVGEAPFHGTTFVGSPFSPVGPVRNIEIALDSTGNAIGYYLLLKTGQLLSLGSVPNLVGTSVDDAIGFKINPDGTGYSILTSTGELFAFGQAPVIEQTIDLGINNKIVDFTFTPDGQGYYLLDQWGVLHAGGNATPIENQVRLEQPVATSMTMGVSTGSVDNLPDDLFPVPTATATATFTQEPTEVPEPTSTFTPTFTPEAPTATNTPELPTATPIEPTITPLLQTPTFTPLATVTNTPVEDPTNTPIGETPTDTPTPTFTNTPEETSTPTNTPEEIETSTPTSTPTVTATPTQGSSIVDPGINSLFLGTFNALVVDNSTGQQFSMTLRIAVENNQVVVEDVNGVLFRTQKLVVTLPDPATVSFNNLGLEIESLNLALTPETGIILGGYLISSGFPPIPQNFAITINLNEQ